MNLSKEIRKIEREYNKAQIDVKTSQANIQNLQEDQKAIEEEANERLKDLQQRAKGIQAEIQEQLATANRANVVMLEKKGILDYLKARYEEVNGAEYQGIPEGETLKEGGPVTESSNEG